MTISQAKELMRRGNNISHILFKKNRYIHMVNNKIVNEKGNDWNDQWLFCEGECLFSDGWYLK